MNRIVLLATAVMGLGISAPAYANTHTVGEELRGQTVDIQFADGTRNSVFFGSTGVATISNQTGQSTNANWFAQGENICLRSGSTQECWSSANRFSAGQTVAMTSSCNSASTWTARSVNAPRQKVAPLIGERG